MWNSEDRCCKVINKTVTNICPLKPAREKGNQRESESERKGGLLADMSAPADSSILLPARVLVTTLLPSACRVLSMNHSHLGNMRQRRETLPSQALRMLYACTPERDLEGYRGSKMFVTPNWR
ncbi:hypothetical protein HJG60_008639 [Phyllostomus discolor]|uniref:Uncharacterized protein n=1 Tax=Phyllostomus discolor TaxID=89673 RepID=A0A833YZB9_9CHIR|nr:hypothetical protein HJG60_008639 [Phyllostomus discolor]